MSDAKAPAPQSFPVGELFSRLYLERGAPIQDSPFFRNRLDAYLQAKHFKNYEEISAYLKQEGGLVVTSTSLDRLANVYFNFSEFFAKTPIERVLSAITLIWRYLYNTYEELVETGNPDNPYVSFNVPAKDWHEFVSRALREENMAYQLDERCGVHFFVDEEFERNRVSVLKCLDAPRYSGVRAAFEAAHTFLDAQPADTKASVRAAFEALEILARLMDSQSRNLNKWMVENKLKSIALKGVTEPTEANTVTRVFDGIALIVDGLHNFRHGQGTEQPVAPSLTLAVFVISMTAAALRWLAELDANHQQPTGA